MFSIKYSSIVVLLILLEGCGSQNSSSQKLVNNKEEPSRVTSIQEYNWMLGTWFAHGLDYFEKWEVIDDSTYQAKVYKELNVEETISEVIVFHYRKGNFYYVPTVANQNKGLPIKFTSVNASKDLIQFENMKHDFPNRIVYFNSSEQEIGVKIEGIRNGEIFKSYDILMSKMEENE